MNKLNRRSIDMWYNIISYSKLVIILVISFLLIKNGSSQNTTIEVNVGVVLDMETWFGKMSFSCISMALSDLYASSHGKNYKTRLVLHTRDSKKNVVGAAAAALDLINNVQVQAILGPVSSMQTEFVIRLGDEAHVPIITFSATYPLLSSGRSPYFFRATLSDSAQVGAISAIIKAFGWREVVPVYEDNEFGEGIIPFLTDALQKIDARVPYRSSIPPSASDDLLEKELYKLMTMQTRVFIVHMSPSLSSGLFKKAEKIGMMSKDYVWIVTDGIANEFNSIDSSVVIDSMQGVLGVGPYVPKSKMLEEFKVRWRRNLLRDNPNTLFDNLDTFGLWAYDAAMALAMAVEKVNATKFDFLKGSNISSSSTGLETLGTSRNGPLLRQELSNIRFKGLTGDFHFVGGQLQSSAFVLFNVIGDGQKKIGFWTPRNGFSKKLNLSSTSPYCTCKTELNLIRWPGGSYLVPKGWVMPVNEQRLRIGVPVKTGFSEFVKVTNTTGSVTGYCIDVFKAVIEALPYAVPYDLIPFSLPNGVSSGNYDDLAYQVYLQKYDAVVGDLTIVENRTAYVDFTLPYAESGVSLVVPVKYLRKNGPLDFFKPFTPSLWCVILGSFILTGIVIWLLEHGSNYEFRGDAQDQAAIIFVFSFSTIAFAHREKLETNVARLVLVSWLFVVLIIVQSYSASLASILTVEQLTPNSVDMKGICNTGESVGYQNGSFVFAFLKAMNIPESRLKMFNSANELEALFFNGSAKGGIGFAIDETPYMRLFIGKHCSKYKRVGQDYKTGGFGFAFPKGSPLVADVSRAILRVTQSEKIAEIENAWFGTPNECSGSISTHSLGVDRFLALVFLPVYVLVGALIWFAVAFLCDQKRRQVLKEIIFDSSSIRTKISKLREEFNKYEESSRAKRRRESEEKRARLRDNQTASDAVAAPK